MRDAVTSLRRLVAAARGLPPAGLAAVACGFLLQLSLGGLFTFGNLTTYLTSYLHVSVGQDVGYGQTIWIGSVLALTEGLTLLPGSALYQRCGPRVPILLGSLMASGSVALTSLSVRKSLAWVAVTYGVVNGLGVGLVYGVPLLVGYKWFPSHKGLVSGVVVGGYGLGGILFTTVQTSFLNPDNVSPDDDGFFHDATLLNRVPRLFLLQAGVCAVLQLVGVFGVRDPPLQHSAQPSTAVQSSAEDKPLPGVRDVDGSRQDSCAPESGAGRDYSLKEAVRTAAAYQLLLGFVLNNFSIAIINPLWKAFGQTFIKDDLFMELVGSGASVFNMLGRLTWGFLCDVFGYKPVMVTLTGLFCALLYTLPATAAGGKAMYLTWIWGMFFCFSGTFSIVVTGTAETFGSENAGQIYGVIFLSGGLIGPLVSLLLDLLLDLYGYAWMFLLGGLVTTGSLVVTLTFQPYRLRLAR